MKMDILFFSKKFENKETCEEERVGLSEQFISSSSNECLFLFVVKPQFL